MDIEIVKLRLYQGLSEDLRKWFKDGGWNRYNTKGEKVGKCARDDKDGDGKADGPKPKCLPASKAASLGKKKVAAAVKRKRSEDPNPNRTGAAKNVNTESIEHIKEFVGTTIAGTAGAATAKKGDKARKALGTGAGYAVGSTLGKVAGIAAGKALGGAAGAKVAGSGIPLIGKAISSAGRAAGSASGGLVGSGVGSIAGGVGGAVAGNKLAGTSKKKKQNEEVEVNEAVPVVAPVVVGAKVAAKSAAKKVVKKVAGKAVDKAKKVGKGALAGAIEGAKKGMKEEVTFQSFNEKAQKCWDTHKKVGMKMKGGKMVNDCRPKNEEVEVEEGAAWTKKSGKSESGGLNEKGRKSYERENPGSDLKAPSKKKGNKRRASFCARMKGMRKRQKPSNNTGDDRLSKSLRAWNC